ncbi:MAG TPA: hypothetical protein VIH90_05465 [Candidatus Saccharimonadales bacterium]
MKLYGVTHGLSVNFGGFELERSQIVPAQEIIDDISKLPPNSVVAVETIEEQFEDLDMQELIFREEDMAYWGEIVDAIRARGHAVAYLDSLQLHAEFDQQRNLADELTKAELGLSDLSIEEGRESEVSEIRFSLEAIADYIFKVEREDLIVQRLRKYMPALAIIGAAHGDYVMLTPDLVSDLGVTEYWHGEVAVPEERGLLLSDNIASRRVQHIEPGDPDPSFIGEREQTIRRYRTATTGRVTVGGPPPALIGSWRVECRPEGLFEVHPSVRDGSKIQGTISDSLGDASFTGEITDSKLRLVKVYDPNRALSFNYISGNIIHEAEAGPDGVYTGVWYSEEWPARNGQLIVRQGDVLYEPYPLSPQSKLF